MHPEPVSILGVEVEIWNLFFLVSVVAGYWVLRASLAIGPQVVRPRWLAFRWLATVYLSAIGAQLFAYAFDLNTTLLPPPSISWVRYYLDPLFGPKTLYGAVVALPVGIVACGLAGGGRFILLLDRWTPPMMATLGITRVGCFLQGCCYGRRHDLLGTVFPVGSPVYFRQLHEGAIATGSPALPVIATQPLEAAVLFALSAACLWMIQRGRRWVFLNGVALYSVARIALEFLRDDPERNALGPFSSSQWIAMIMLALYGIFRLLTASARQNSAVPQSI